MDQFTDYRFWNARVVGKARRTVSTWIIESRV